MDDEGPIAVRDFPVGCRKFPKSISKNLTRPQATRTCEVEEAEQGEGELPINFEELSARDQFLQRRALFSQLLHHYQILRKSGKWVGHRPDLQAMKQMNVQGTSFDFQSLGDVPGVMVGNQFQYRTEMFVVGLHRQVQGGIGWVQDRAQTVACSVVVSGGYRDDDDNGETIKYSGQGGNDYKGDKRQLEDQKPTTGNESLVNSCKRGGVVRVIRGHDAEESGWNKIYSYDGLYRVAHYDHKMGQDGHKVYTFDLHRLSDQPPLDIEQWRSSHRPKN